MDWPSEDAVSEMIPLPEGYRAERLSCSELPSSLECRS